MEEKYFMIVCGCIHKVASTIDIVKEEQKLCSKIANIFSKKNTSEHKTEINNTCIIKTSFQVEEIRFKIAELLISSRFDPQNNNQIYGNFEQGCYFEVYVLQMDSPFPVLPVFKSNTNPEKA